MQPLRPTELADWVGREDDAAPIVLDVREPWERAVCSLPRAVHIPMREVPARLAELDPQRPIVCVCHHGGRSAQVGLFLERQGFAQVYNLSGGIDAWAQEVDPSCPRY